MVPGAGWTVANSAAPNADATETAMAPAKKVTRWNIIG
jgi:hypothetical protein